MFYGTSTQDMEKMNEGKVFIDLPRTFSGGSMVALFEGGAAVNLYGARFVEQLFELFEPAPTHSPTMRGLLCQHRTITINVKIYIYRWYMYIVRFEVLNKGWVTDYKR